MDQTPCHQVSLLSSAVPVSHVAAWGPASQQDLHMRWPSPHKPRTSESPSPARPPAHAGHRCLRSTQHSARRGQDCAVWAPGTLCASALRGSHRTLWQGTCEIWGGGPQVLFQDISGSSHDSSHDTPRWWWSNVGAGDDTAERPTPRVSWRGWGQGQHTRLPLLPPPASLKGPQLRTALGEGRGGQVRLALPWGC